MHRFPEPEAIDAELAAAGPLPVLYCHGCGAETCGKESGFHLRLAPIFARRELKLLCDDFIPGDDVQVAMRAFRIHGVVFHADAKSIGSAAASTEWKTAKANGILILTLCDGVALPEELRERISIKLPSRAAITPAAAESLAQQMRERARVHWVCQWIAESGRSPEEREAGAAWLGRQRGQVLAEFFPAIARLHRGAQEDPTFSARLATVLERTNLRREGRLHLVRWHGEVKNILSWMSIEDVLVGWGYEAPERFPTDAPRRSASRGSTLLLVALSVLAILVVFTILHNGIHIDIPGWDEATKEVQKSITENIRQEDL